MMVTWNPFFYVLVLVLLMLAVAWLGTVVYLALRRRWAWALGLAVVGLAAPVWLIVTIFHPLGPVETLRILDQTDLADGTELALTQSRNRAWTEPYSIHLWVKPPEKPWGCVQIDFESRWWRRGRIVVRGNWITLVRGRDEVFCGFTRRGASFLADGDDDPMIPFWVGKDWEPREGGEYRAALHAAAMARTDETLNEESEPKPTSRATGSSHGRE